MFRNSLLTLWQCDSTSRESVRVRGVRGVGKKSRIHSPESWVGKGSWNSWGSWSSWSWKEVQSHESWVLCHESKIGFGIRILDLGPPQTSTRIRRAKMSYCTTTELVYRFSFVFFVPLWWNKGGWWALHLCVLCEKFLKARLLRIRRARRETRNDNLVR